MNTFIGCETISILGRNYGTDSANTKDHGSTPYEVNAHKEAESQQSFWTKIASKVKTVWGKIKPVVSGLTTFFTVTATFVKAVTKFGTQCKNLKEVFA